MFNPDCCHPIVPIVLRTGIHCGCAYKTYKPTLRYYNAAKIKLAFGMM